ncbi:MAG: DUF2092 domain-containing protein [Candidatus Competibacteraceae bacterium]|nr:DUF2092 domain-containing protein [Candidatus Competibacteraceae bacterium]MBK8753736.1 DUF2092 domain-containing protein [Candidatus Competibacteraceae bacterium]
MKKIMLLSATLLPILALIGCASPPPATDQPASSSAPPAPITSAQPVVKPQPMDVLKQMAAYLKSLERFTVRVEKTTELILPTNQRLHADQTVEIAMQRPNHLRVNYQNLSGGRQLFYDGKTFSLYTLEPNVYATAAAPPTIDETLDRLADHYQISMPVADLLTADPQSRLVQNLKSSVYVGRALVHGVVCYHLAFQTPEVDWEIWIEEGSKPLPRRLLITDKSVEGAPAMTASLSNWNLTPQFSADTFTFKPPQNAQKIAFLADLPAAKPAKPAKAAQ